MTTITKATKDKIYGANPRLMPRQTAASAARAARNATNRNLTLPIQTQRTSPTRANSSSASTASTKVTKSPLPQRSNLKTDSKTDVKITSNVEYEQLSPENILMTISNPTTEEIDSFTNEEAATVLLPNTEVLIDNTIEMNLQGINESDKLEELRSSRPQTPTINSRPLTPKSLQSSRPQTPRILSRPITPTPPVAPALRYSVPTSRPNTPNHLSTPTRPKTPSNLPMTYNKSRQDITKSPYTQRYTINENGDLQSLFQTKKSQFQHMKKELDFKQQEILEIFDCLQNLQERMSREGVSGCGEGVQHQELVVFNVADWAADEIAQLCRDAVASSDTDNAMELIATTVVIDEKALNELDAKVLNIPACFADLCLQAFTSRQEIIDWIKEQLNSHEGSEVLQSISRFNSEGLQFCESLQDLKARADVAVEAITQLCKRVHQERVALLSVGESLVREIAQLRQELEAHNKIINEMRELRVDCETTKALEDTRRELDEERHARTGTKEKLATTEIQLRQTRARVSKMDKQLREAEASIASLTGTVKMLEDQSRQKEVQLEARARKLKESLKTGEVASGHLVQQRDALQAEVRELKEQINSLTAQNKSTVQDLSCQLRDVKSALEEQCQLTKQETQSNEAAKKSLSESQNTIEELKTKVAELENSRPNPDLPTEREMDLWAELQATKDTLRITEEEINACKREKVRFIETLTKITESENKVGLQQKLAAELLSKEEIIGKMQIQVRELTKNIKLNEQKVIQYEQYVGGLQAHNRAVANCQESPNGISYQDLQQEIMSLKMNLLDAVHRNEELSELVMQKEQQLEHQDKTSRAQARVIKVREELINMLKNKETEQSRELAALQQDLENRMKVVDEVNKQIAAKADEIQELFTTLENKQQQIHRLEKIVLALEEQQRRSQAQRTRHEEKIAALEHELAAGGNKRERKFIFF